MPQLHEEIQGLQTALDILVQKKNYFLQEWSIASDAAIKFSLNEKLAEVERELDACRAKIQLLHQEAPDNPEIERLQQQMTTAKQMTIQQAEKIYNIDNIDNANFS